MLVALWLMLTMNLPFWHSVWQGVGGMSNDSPLFLLSLPLFVWIWLYVLLSMLAWGRLTKPVLALLVLVSAGASYFMNSYGIVIDYNMLTNMLQTDVAEATELFNGRLLLWLLLLGVLPALLISRMPTRPLAWRRELAGKLGSMAVLLGVFAVLVMSQYQPYASLIRNHREVRLMLVPSNVVGAVHGYLKRELAAPVTLEVVGADAHRISAVGVTHRPRVTVVVVGETARAANFSLNGYARPTNPELAERDVINYPQASSCGTATAVSVPCMFQDVGRADYKESMAGNREGMLDVLQRAGVGVLWRDNNSGCKGACDRVPSEDVSHLKLAEFCADGECHDEALLHNLQTYLDGLTRDTVVVLHMKGSHGPAYYKRYPAAFERFTPVCKNVQLDRCDTASIVNAYDNSLLYTDHVLAATIDLLRSNAARLDTAMLYMSDHGESLGELGMYLHGVPYAMAPSEQTHVPMVLWFSDGMQRSSGISADCLRQQAGQPVSQDNLFHSVIGLMGVRTSVYQPQLDIFRGCMPATVAVHLGDTQLSVD
ncbi:MAG: phosphoethanolamine--lipid A transferase [Gammaproteobacteria bacterium]|nr:phosphoethanolamine--lipid A transferase [Gammaproteobacteria bacterium]MBU2156331.1 phosphoethanolamine--lipid A transferase [Gammaproteobacteria bacterium]MBU2256803.1 phosphoethanolamine--lipid A transferase [Gammaproteobacteria bacterium]MBU2293050.1 phosphoethanolamine--lipid A transferase [Gammaproteobacteria bacterium]